MSIKDDKKELIRKILQNPHDKHYLIVEEAKEFIRKAMYEAYHVIPSTLRYDVYIRRKPQRSDRLVADVYEGTIPVFVNGMFASPYNPYEYLRKTSLYTDIEELNMILEESLDELRERITIRNAKEAKEYAKTQHISKRMNIAEYELDKNIHNLKKDSEVSIEPYGLFPINKKIYLTVRDKDTLHGYTIGGLKSEHKKLKEEYPELSEIADIAKLYTTIEDEYIKEHLSEYMADVISDLTLSYLQE